MPYIIHVPPSSTKEGWNLVNGDKKNYPPLLTRIEKVSGNSPFMNKNSYLQTIVGNI